MMDRHELARIFNETGLLLELKGENPFKARAYYNAARTVENLGEDLEKLVKEERLHEVPGFGEAIVKKIHEWAQTGKIEFYENLKNTTPPGLLEFLRIPGLGPKRINQLYTVLFCLWFLALGTLEFLVLRWVWRRWFSLER